MHLRILAAACSVAFVLLLSSPASASTKCLTGTDASVADDPTKIGAVRALIDAACPCASYDGSDGLKHGDYVKCAKAVIAAQVAASSLRKQCAGTVMRYYAASTCGFAAETNRAVCIKKTTSTGKVACTTRAMTKNDGVTPSGKCVGKPGKFEEAVCAGFTHCIDAADTNGDLRIAAPLDTGVCAACTADDQCDTAHCADGLCCDSACSGTCESCALPGSEGTCVLVAAGNDPDEECGALSCASYYAGFSGDTCYRRADAEASEVMCNGAGACETSAAVCASQPAGPASVTCDPLCQDPSAGTCTGTTAGVCTNVSAGSTTCGLGVCQVTSPVCVAGTPNACVPNSGAASTETCNNLDDNCDGTIDNNPAFADTREPNNSCASFATLPTVGSDQTLTQNTLTIYPSGDADYFRINAVETDSSCACCDFFCTDEDYKLTVTLTVPFGAGSYTFCAAPDCASVGSSCQNVIAGSSASWSFNLDGTCTGTDSYSAFVRVTPGSSPGFECAPYTLSYNFDAGVCL